MRVGEKNHLKRVSAAERYEVGRGTDENNGREEREM
jgi:hypothetical protein